MGGIPLNPTQILYRNRRLERMIKKNFNKLAIYHLLCLPSISFAHQHHLPDLLNITDVTKQVEQAYQQPVVRFNGYGGLGGNLSFQESSKRIKDFLYFQIAADTPFMELVDLCASFREEIARKTSTPHPEYFSQKRMEANAHGWNYTPIVVYPLMRERIAQFLSTHPTTTSEWVNLDEHTQYRFRIQSFLKWLLDRENNTVFQYLHSLKALDEKAKESEQAPQPTEQQEAQKEAQEALDILQKKDPAQHANGLSLNDVFKKLLFDATQKAHFGIDIPDLQIGLLECRRTSPDLTMRAVVFPVGPHTQLNFKNVPFTLIHPPVPEMKDHMAYCEALFQAARQDLPDTPTDLHDIEKREEIRHRIAQFWYQWAITMPFNRGSAAMGEWLAEGLYKAHNMSAWIPCSNQYVSHVDQLVQSALTFDDFYKEFVKLSPSIDLKPVIESNDQGLEDRLIPFKEEGFDVYTGETPLCRIMQEIGSDKGSGRHNYTQLYHYLLKDKQDKPLKILELGIGSCDPQFAFTMGQTGVVGASLRGWRTYFKNAQVFGADIDKEALFQEDRIQTFYVDALNPESIKALFETMPESTFDVIVDDGYHDFSANSEFLKEALGHLSVGGMYIIEDIRTDQLPLFQTILTCMQRHKAAIIQLPNFSNVYDNNVMIFEKK